MQHYRLGIDIGTASVACAAFALKDGAPTEIIHCACRIFEEPLQPGTSGGVGDPKKARRRLARQQRRQHHRRAQRLRNIAALGPKIGVPPAETPPDCGQTIHQIRATAAEESILLPDLFRVFLHLAKRRGYMGVFRGPKAKKNPPKKAAADSAEPNLGQVREGVKTLHGNVGDGTLGQYLLRRVQNGLHLRLKADGLYADKAMVEDEFDRIWKTQEAAHPVLRKGGEALREEFRNAIFFKRPLRSPAPMVGNCELESDLPRAPMAHPAAQEFRMEQAIADLEFVAPGRRRRQSLSSPQREVVRKMLREKHEIQFAKMEDKMRLAGCPPPNGMSFNFARGGRDAWKKGDKTAEVMRKLKLTAQWSALDENAQTTVVNLLADIDDPEFFQSDPEWHKNIRRKKGGDSRRQFASPVVDFINVLAAHPKFNRLTKMGFDGGRASYCVKALRKITVKMRDDGADFANAKALVYPDSVPQKGEKRKLKPLLSPPVLTGNTVVDVALRQFRRTINAVISELGPPQETVIELSRDIALGLKKRGEIESKIRAKEKERESARKEAEEELKRPPTRREINRTLLWREQGRRWCPYCESVINLGDALNDSKDNPLATESEHILPSSVTRIRGQRAYLVLAHKSCNDAKKNKTPWQAWGDGRDSKRWGIVQERAEQFRAAKQFGKSSQLLHDGDALDAKELAEFSARQFAETSWIGRQCASWMREICPDVSVSRGRMTAYLRRHWGLDKVIPQLRYEDELPVLDKKGGEIPRDEFAKDPRRANKRIDHRHHMVDAVVIGLTGRSLFQKMTRLFQERTESGKAGFGNDDLEVPPMISGLPAMVKKFAADLSNLSHRPDRRPAGPLFDDSAYAARRDENKTLRYAKRISLESLVTPKDSEKTAKGKIGEIVDPQIRAAVLSAFEERIAKGEKPGAALHQGVPHPANQTRIRRVRRFQPDKITESAVHAEHRARDPKKPGEKKTLRKILKPIGYAWLEVSPQGKKKLVRLHEVAAQPKRTPKGGKRFYKNDTVCGPATGGIPYVVRQLNVAGGGSLFITRATEHREVKEFRKGETALKIVGSAAKLLNLEVMNG